MRSLFLFTALFAFISNVYSQNIVNTLGSGGTFTVEDDGNVGIQTITNAGTVTNILGTSGSYLIQDGTSTFFRGYNLRVT